jgi:hypothetical protein
MFKYLLFFSVVVIFVACGQTKSPNQENDRTENFVTLTKDQRMDTTYFWKIMDYGFKKGEFDNKVKKQAILEQLTKLGPEQIQEFEIIFQQMNKKASTWGNLAAQTVIEGGSSDDRFYYFRCWLISLGKKNFEETLKNPDYLALLNIPLNEEFGEMYCQFEELIPMADKAYEIVTSKDPSTDTTFPRPHADKLGLFYDSGTTMTGIEWKSNDELPKIVPLLYKKYGDKQSCTQHACLCNTGRGTN